MSFLVFVTSSAFLASLPPMLSVPCFASCFAFSLLIVSSVSSLGVRSLFSPLPALAPAPGGARDGVDDGFEAGVAGVVDDESESLVELVELDEFDLLDGASSLASFFLTSTSGCFFGSALVGASSLVLHFVILHQNHASMSSMINICELSLI